MRRFAAAVLTIAALGGMGVAAVWTVRAAVADYEAGRETTAATEKAISWMPNEAAHYFRLALLVSDEQPERAIDALRRAVALNPWKAEYWIELGLRYEGNGDNAAAERCFLRAASVDNQYLPRWTLANYYFRRGESAKFWRSARQAAQMAYGDASPLFRLCDAMPEPGDLIDRLEIRSPAIRASYVSYLLAHGRTDVAGGAARRLIESPREADIPLALAACDRMLNERRTEDALDIWNRLSAAGRIPFKSLSPADGRALTNGRFLVMPISHGFDWRLANVGGVAASGEGKDGGLRLAFSGRQPERCAPLWQMAPVIENREYEFRCAYRTSAIAAGAGLRWLAYDANGGAPLAVSDSLSSERGGEAVLRFRTPDQCRLVRLALGYERAKGTTRIEGEIVVDAAKLDAVRQEGRQSKQVN
jgi:tetratricopeptide (TPR) repeat protein